MLFRFLILDVFGVRALFAGASNTICFSSSVPLKWPKRMNHSLTSGSHLPFAALAACIRSFPSTRIFAWVKVTGQEYKCEYPARAIFRLCLRYFGRLSTTYLKIGFLFPWLSFRAWPGLCFSPLASIQWLCRSPFIDNKLRIADLEYWTSLDTGFRRYDNFEIPL